MKQFIELRIKAPGNNHKLQILSVHETNYELKVLVQVDGGLSPAGLPQVERSDGVVVATSVKTDVKLPVIYYFLKSAGDEARLPIEVIGKPEVHYGVTREEFNGLVAGGECLYQCRDDGMKALRLSRLNKESLPILQLINEGQGAVIKDGVTPSILNVYTAVDGDAVKLVFESIYKKNSSEEIPDIRQLFIKAQEKLGKTNISLPQDLFMLEDDCLHFKVDAAGKVTKYITSACEFTLPHNDPQLLVDFMLLVDEVMNGLYDVKIGNVKFDYIQQSGHSILSFINKGETPVCDDLIGHYHLKQDESISLGDFLNLSGVVHGLQSVADYVLSDICINNQIPADYADVRQFLVKYYQPFGMELFKNPASFFEKVYRIPVSNLFTEVGEKEKLALIDDLERLLLKEDNLRELSFFISELNAWAVEQLINPARGYFAYNGKPYTESYTEFAFFRDAKFRVHDDGRVYIQPQESYGYEKHYAATSDLRELFEPEIRHLANILELEFDEDCNFEENIIFTEESSQKLKAMGLHINIPNLRAQANYNHDRESSLQWFSLFSKSNDETRSDRICSCLPERCVIL